MNSSKTISYSVCVMSWYVLFLDRHPERQQDIYTYVSQFTILYAISIDDLMLGSDSYKKQKSPLSFLIQCKNFHLNSIKSNKRAANTINNWKTFSFTSVCVVNRPLFVYDYHSRIYIKFYPFLNVMRRLWCPFFTVCDFIYINGIKWRAKQKNRK